MFKKKPTFIRKVGFFMKKVIIIVSVLILAIIMLNKQEDYVIVPNESIRFRIIPNSNIPEDIYMKEKVKENISNIIKDIETSDDINESRKNVISSINLIENNINELFQDNNYNKTFNVKYGLNHFPEKVYKGVKYEEGNYESMVIEIGQAKGDNYWCVLFPPLCLIEAEESDEIEYKFFIADIINKFLKR